MLIKIITLKFDTLTENFDDSFLMEFVKDKEIISIRDYFFVRDGVPYLVIITTYRLRPVFEERIESGKGRKENWRNLIGDGDLPLFNTLRNWRSERCKKDGVPPYVICTNEQLAMMVKNRPQSLNKLLEIEGVGKAKVEKYGREILSILRIQNMEGEGEKPVNNDHDPEG